MTNLELYKLALDTIKEQWPDTVLEMWWDKKLEEFTFGIPGNKPTNPNLVSFGKYLNGKKVED